MKKIVYTLLTLSILSFTACKNKAVKTQQHMEHSDDMDQMKSMDMPSKITFDMEAKSGSSVSGTVEFTVMGDQVMLMAYLSGLTPGEHAIHIHEKADCSSDDGTSSGGHWNPTHEPHGQWGSENGYHKGDIGNFTADENGNATVHFMTDQWCIGCGDPNKDILGKAVIVHQGTDDYESQPSGAAGSRVSCSGIIQ